MRRDKTKALVKHAKLYIDENDKNTSIEARRGSFYIYNYYVKKCLGLEEKKVILDGKKIKIWSFNQDCEYSQGKLSASRIASLLIKYRRALKELGAIHKKFIPSLEAAKKELIKAGMEQQTVNSLHPNLKVKTLEERIALLKRKYPKGSKSGTGAIIRQALDSIRIYHPSYYRLGGAVSYVKSITNEQQKIRLKAKHDEKIKVNPAFLLNKARAVLDDDKSKWTSLTVALCAVTGRRPTEIMKTAKFRIDNHTPENYIKFSGLLKSRDRRLDDDFGEWDIPIFHDAKTIIRARNRIRLQLRKYEQKAQEAKELGHSKTGGYLRYLNRKGEDVIASIFDPTLIDDVDHNLAINLQYNGVLNDELRSWFESGDIEIKSLRAIYTKMVWEREKETSTETYDSMTTRVLCYSKDSISEAVKHYAAIELSNKIEKIETTKGTGKTYIPSEEFLKKMEEANSIIEKRSLRAPALKRIHQWAKSKASMGLSVSELKPSYIRRHCLVDGKKINDRTAKLYLALIGI
ncbi:protelomerase family protein [Arsenophonus nasoniae]|uniref:Protelomerase family protein n=1 Tax=Arsenophonus nasoniae TaxID=638 RepID=A0ABY8NZN9_9GAMM|nr:protelomerase family protein [Arsenophonus nasoniae]WGM09204.1 protelomerase family protein [Arsenophonus nasoniae]